MVSSISGFSSLQSMGAMGGMGGPRHSTQPLTDEQKQQVSDILSEYDAENLTAEDAKEIFDSFREAGIQPGSDLKSAIEAAGFDSEELRSLGPRPPEGGPRPPSGSSASGSQSINVEALQSLQDILSQYDLENLSSDDQQSLFSALDSAGFMQSGSMLNIGV